MVDVVGAQAGQARFETTTDLHRVAAPLPVGEADRVSPFRGDHGFGSPTFEGRTEVLLRLAAPVALRGVEVGDAGLECRVDHGLGLLRVEPHPEVVAAETDDRDLQLTEWAVLHGSNLSKSNT